MAVRAAEKCDALVAADMIERLYDASQDPAPYKGDYAVGWEEAFDLVRRIILGLEP